MLTNEQIDQLYAFCRKKSVTFYDVQVELVDHLANAIEEKMAAQPALNFDEALQQVYKTFGTMGFGPVVREKEKAVRRSNTRLFWRQFREQWTWPKILVVLSIFGVSYTALQWFDREIVRTVAMFIFLFFVLASGWAMYLLRRMQRKSGHQFLLVNLASVVNQGYAPLNVLIFISQFRESSPTWTDPNSLYGTIVFSVFFALYIVLAISAYQSIRHIQDTLRNAYPNLFNAKTA